MAEQSPAPDADDAGGGPDGEGTTGDGVGSDGVTGSGDDARVLGLESADAGDVIGAVSSETGRSVLGALDDDPATASGLAERLDCPLQTVQYHLDNLDEAGLVEVVDTTTSEKGREMDVYGPAGEPVVVYAGDEDDAADLRSVLARLVSGVAFLGVASLLVQELLAREPAPEPGTVEMTAEAAGKAAGTAATRPEPGLVFFAGGVVVLVAYLSWWHLRTTGRLDDLSPL